jgi:hypothetical protein
VHLVPAAGMYWHYLHSTSSTRYILREYYTEEIHTNREAEGAGVAGEEAADSLEETAGRGSRGSRM